MSEDYKAILHREIAQAVVARTMGMSFRPITVPSTRMRLWHIKTPEDLEDLAQAMKFDSRPDEDAPSEYSQTKEAVEKVSKNMAEAPEEVREQVMTCSRAIFHKNKIYSITLTQGLHPDFLLEGFDWHLSMAMVDGPTPSRAPDDICRLVCESFFAEHQEIPNPGKMEGVRHFAGKD